MPLIIFLPIIIVFLLSYLTKNVLLSLSVANLIGIIILTYNDTCFTFLNFIKKYIHVYLKTFVPDTIMILLFIFLLSCIIEILIHSKITNMYAELIKKKINNKKSLEKFTLCLNYFFFIDDFLGAFSLKAFIYPLIKTYKLASVKLAYLINSQFTSLCVLIPLSSWGLMLIGQYASIQLIHSGDSLYNPISLLFGVIPFLLYPLNSIFNAWFTVLNSISFGTMKTFEEQEYIQKDIPLKKENSIKNNNEWYDFFTPFIIFFVSLFIYFIAFIIKNKNNNLIEALQHIPFIKYMFYSALISYIFSIIFFKKMISFKELYTIHKETFISIRNPVLLIISAWTFSYIISELHIFGCIFNYCSAFNLHMIYPIIFFILSFLASVSIGSEWGVLSLIIPIIGNLNIVEPSMLYVLLGSTISGVMAGCHFTPISNDMVIVSTNVKCNVLDHYKTHSEYSKSPLIASFIGFVSMTLLIIFNVKSLFLIAFLGLAISFFITALITWYKNKKAINL